VKIKLYEPITIDRLTEYTGTGDAVPVDDNMAIYKKLAYFEDLQEQGRLIELPPKRPHEYVEQDGQRRWKYCVCGKLRDGDHHTFCIECNQSRLEDIYIEVVREINIYNERSRQ